METFYHVLAVGGALSICIIILTVFFTAVSYFNRAFRDPDPVKVKGFIREGKRVSVHLAGGRTLEHVRFVGFTDGNSGKGNIPYQLAGMAVFETEEGTRISVRADSIRMIEEEASP